MNSCRNSLPSRRHITSLAIGIYYKQYFPSYFDWAQNVIFTCVEGYKLKAQNAKCSENI